MNHSEIIPIKHMTGIPQSPLSRSIKMSVIQILPVNGMLSQGPLSHSLGGEVIITSCQHCIAPSLNLMLCLSSLLLIIACLNP